MIREELLSRKRANSKKLRQNSEYQKYEKDYSIKYRKQAHVKRKRVRNQVRYERKYKYGLTEHDYNQMKHNQGYRCAICKTDNPGGSRDWCVDHDHQTGKVRSLLCFMCNIGLGFFKDNPQFLSEAVQYLNKHK